MLIKIPVHQKAELQFWIRAFQLEDEIAVVVSRLHERPEHKSAFAPIISEYQSGSITWVFILGATIDPLGLSDGQGFVWLTTGTEHFAEAIKARNKLADELLAWAEHEGKFDETLEFEPKKDV